MEVYQNFRIWYYLFDKWAEDGFIQTLSLSFIGNSNDWQKSRVHISIFSIKILISCSNERFNIR